MDKKEKKLALVTGASRGIGAEIAKKLAQDGFHVAINFSSSSDRAKSVLDSIHLSGGTGELCGFDVSNSDSVEASIKTLTENFGAPIHTLVNNAGVSYDGLLIRLKPNEIDKLIDINLKGSIYCTRSAVRGMLKEKDGVVIMISSVIGEIGNQGQSVYSATKAGLIGFSKSVAKEFASRNIRCNSITPGFISTEMTDELSDEQRETILKQIPLGKFGTPADVAELVSFLSSNRAKYITGQVLGINGGLKI